MSVEYKIRYRDTETFFEECVGSVCIYIYYICIYIFVYIYIYIFVYIYIYIYICIYIFVGMGWGGVSGHFCEKKIIHKNLKKILN